MKRYYVNKKKQNNRGHEVHIEECHFLPKTENRIYLGQFNSCTEAIADAKKHYNKVKACKHCLEECHTG